MRLALSKSWCASVLARVSVSSGARSSLTAGTTGADTAYAYIDGSFDKHIGAVGSGGVIFYNGATEEFSFGMKDPFYTAYWNVSGEAVGSYAYGELCRRKWHQGIDALL